MCDCNDMNELTPAYHTGSAVCPCAPCVRWSNPLRAFWPEPVSIFGSLSMTMPEAVHLCWVFHSACPSDRIDARSRGNNLAAISSSRRWRDVVPAASDPTVTSRASADRLLRTESQVRLTIFMSYRTIIVTTLCHTEALPLVWTRFLRLANSSPKTARSPARWSRDGRETSGKTSGEISRVMSAQRPGNGRTVAAAMPPNVRQDSSQDNLPCAGLGRAMSAPETCETTRNTSAQQPCRSPRIGQCNTSQAAHGNSVVSF